MVNELNESNVLNVLNELNVLNVLNEQCTSSVRAVYQLTVPEP